MCRPYNGADKSALIPPRMAAEGRISGPKTASQTGLSQSLGIAVKEPGRGRISRREPSLKTTPTRPLLGLLTKFATGPRLIVRSLHEYESRAGYRTMRQRTSSASGPVHRPGRGTVLPFGDARASIRPIADTIRLQHRPEAYPFAPGELHESARRGRFAFGRPVEPLLSADANAHASAAGGRGRTSWTGRHCA